jgi:hypothetical protein
VPTLAWVGPGYDQTRTILIGENLYDHGGLDALSELVRLAKLELSAGKRRVSYGASNYRGTLIWHRAAVYVHKWLAAADGEAGEEPSGPDVAAILDQVAFTNHVKCSPRASSGSRSTPNEAMWFNCGQSILKREIELLAPTRVLALGLNNGRRFLLNVCPNARCLYSASGLVSFDRDDTGMQVLSVRHPAAPGGASRAVIQAVSDALQAAQALAPPTVSASATQDEVRSGWISEGRSHST